MKLNIDYYKVMGLNNTADDSLIKKTYITLSKIHHPDKGGDVDNFNILLEAYNVLKNNKDEYDTKSIYGKNYVAEKSLDDLEFLSSKFDDDLYNKFTKVKSKILDIYVKAPIEGNVISYERTLQCSVCEGSGVDMDKLRNCLVCKGDGKNKDGDDCYLCMGKGKLTHIECEMCDGVGSYHNQTCTVCHGIGEIKLSNCHKCKGDGIYTKKVSVSFNRNDAHENKIFFSMLGNQNKKGTQGNLIIIIE